MTQFSSVLLAVDASPYAEVATRYAVLLSKRLGVPLRAVHVIDLRAVTTPSQLEVGMGDPVLSTPYLDTELQEVMEKRAEEVRASTQALLTQLGASAELEVPTGPVEHEILNRVEGETLIVIGKEGESAESEGSPRLGSVAERVVRRAEGAVLLVPKNFTEPQRLVLGYDGSDGAEGALTYTLALAKPTKLPVLALNVQSDEAAKAPLERALEHAQRDGVNLSADVLQGDPTEAMVGATQADDIIAIGAFETGRLAEFFRGSTTRAIVLGVAGPVLLHH